MNSISQEIIENLNNRLLHQTVIINILCDIVIENNLITEEELTKRINSEIFEINMELDKLSEEDDNEELSELLSGYIGPIGEA